MLTAFLHRLVAQPWVYDLCQTLVGAKYVRRRLARRIEPIRASRFVLDIGGGTGAVRDYWGPACRYVCLDIDPLKLRGYAAKNPGGLAILADATAIPLADGSVDAVVCTSVTHHLPDTLLPRMLAEAARVLKPVTGRLVLLDAAWAPWLPTGRLLWRYDRGSFPRPATVTRALIEASFEVESWDRFTVLHEYFICVGQPLRRNTAVPAVRRRGGDEAPVI